MKQGAKLYELAPNAIANPGDPQTGFIYDFSFPKEKGDPNPHLWMNPVYADTFAALMRDWFSAVDPANALPWWTATSGRGGLFTIHSPFQSRSDDRE